MPGTGLKASQSSFHLILMITCEGGNHSHFKTEKTDRESVTFLGHPPGKAGAGIGSGQALLGPLIKQAHGIAAASEPHQRAPCSCSLQSEVLCYVFPPGGEGGGPPSRFFLSKCQGSFSTGKIQTNVNGSTSIRHCNSSSKEQKTPRRKPLCCE